MKYFKCINDNSIVKINVSHSMDSRVIYEALCNNKNFIEITKQEYNSLNKIK